MKTIYAGFLSTLFLLLVINANAQIPDTRSGLDTNRHPVRDTNDRNIIEVMVFAKIRPISFRFSNLIHHNQNL